MGLDSAMNKTEHSIQWRTVRSSTRKSIALGAQTILLLCGIAMADPAPVNKLGELPHNYWEREPQDTFAALFKKMEQGEVKLDTSSEKAQLLSLLSALDVPVSSQLLVYSATSFQGGLIRPANPRALYFNDDVYVGYVPGGSFELASIDPALGPIFRVFKPTRSGIPEVTRTQRCMNCHAARTSKQVPGLVAESVICTTTGGSLDGFRRDEVGHTIPLSDRLGGWVVTGSHEHGDHLGNLLGDSVKSGYKRFKNPPGKIFDWSNYPTKTSDLLPHLLHEHQLGFHNLVTLGVYRTRDAVEAGLGTIRPDDNDSLNDIARQLVRYILFANEAALPKAGIRPDPTFVKDFATKRKATSGGASLRDLDLHTRLLKYRCSYMVHSIGFTTLPDDFKKRVLSGLASALRESGAPAEFNYLPATEKRVISLILRETGVMP